MKRRPVLANTIAAAVLALTAAASIAWKLPAALGTASAESRVGKLVEHVHQTEGMRRDVAMRLEELRERLAQETANNARQAKKNSGQRKHVAELEKRLAELGG